MPSRRKFIQLSLTAFPILAGCQKSGSKIIEHYKKSVVVSTWDSGIRANSAAWKILAHNGRALDTVEAATKYAETEKMLDRTGRLSGSGQQNYAGCQHHG